MKNRIFLNDYHTKRDKITIECSTDSYDSDNRHAIEAGKILEAFLIDQFNLEEKKDYTKNYPSSGRVSIEISGKANVILALNLVLFKEKIFSLDWRMSGGDNTKRNWSRKLGEYIIAALVDDDLSRIDMDKLSTITKETLDGAYQFLLKDPLAVSLPNKTVNDQINGQYLKHPFYQLLSLILEDFNEREKLYHKMGFIEKLRVGKPDAKALNELFVRFEFLLPTCYCTTGKIYSSGDVEKIGFNSDRINSSRIIATSSPSISSPPPQVVKKQ